MKILKQCTGCIWSLPFFGWSATLRSKSSDSAGPDSELDSQVGNFASGLTIDGVAIVMIFNILLVSWWSIQLSYTEIAFDRLRSLLNGGRRVMRKGLYRHPLVGNESLTLIQKLLLTLVRRIDLRFSSYS